MEILRSSFVVVCKCSSTVHSRRYLISWSLFKMIRSRFISVHYSHNFSRCFMSTIVHNSFNLIVSKWCIFAFNTHILFPTIKESTIYSITPTWRIQTNKSLSQSICPRTRFAFSGTLLLLQLECSVERRLDLCVDSDRCFGIDLCWFHHSAESHNNRQWTTDQAAPHGSLRSLFIHANVLLRWPETSSHHSDLASERDRKSVV